MALLIITIKEQQQRRAKCAAFDCWERCAVDKTRYEFSTERETSAVCHSPFFS
jgi:hypothetical protein